MTTQTSRYDFFFRAERNNGSLNGQTFDEYWSTRSPYSVSLDLPVGTSLEAALTAARVIEHMPAGSHRGGCFQVQCDEGIWNQEDSRKINPKTMKGVSYKTWDELAEEDEIEIDDTEI